MVGVEQLEQASALVVALDGGGAVGAQRVQLQIVLQLLLGQLSVAGAIGQIEHHREVWKIHALRLFQKAFLIRVRLFEPVQQEGETSAILHFVGSPQIKRRIAELESER